MMNIIEKLDNEFIKNIFFNNHFIFEDNLLISKNLIFMLNHKSISEDLISMTKSLLHP